MSATMTARLPRAPREIPIDRSLDHVAPKLRAAVQAVCDDVARETGARPIVAETVRTNERQQFLYGFGRDYDDGRGVVTDHCDADESWHFYGLAVDLWHPTLEYNAPASWFAAVGRAAARHGLRWGGDWDYNPATHERLVDLPHVQFGKPMRLAPSPRAARLYAQGGLEAVWREVGAA